MLKGTVCTVESVLGGGSVAYSRYPISQTITHMHGQHATTMGLAGVSLGRELRALAMSYTAPVQRGTA